MRLAVVLLAGLVQVNKSIASPFQLVAFIAQLVVTPHNASRFRGTSTDSVTALQVQRAMQRDIAVLCFEMATTDRIRMLQGEQRGGTCARRGVTRTRVPS